MADTSPRRRGVIERLSVRDATNLYMHQGGIQMVIGWLAVLDGHTDAPRPSVESIRAAIARRLDRVPRLRQRILQLSAGLGRPIWVDDADFDLDRHVHHRRLPRPAGASDDLLLEQVEEVFARSLELDRPPWDVHILTGPDGRAVAVVQRIHHAMADGAASAAIAAALMDLGPDPDSSSWSPQLSPPGWRLLADNLRRWAATIASEGSRLGHPLQAAHRAWRLAVELRAMFAWQRDAPPTSINQPVGPDRRLVVVHARLAEVKAASHRHGATVNDVILTAAAGGLRELLSARGDPVDGLQLQVAVPISIRAPTSDGDGVGNATSSMLVPLRLDEPDASRRLREIAADTRRLKTNRAWLAINGLMDSPFVPPAVHRKVGWLTRNQRLVHLFVSNVPGPTQPLKLTGTPIGDVVPVVPVTGNVPIAIGAISYAGTLTLGIRHCPDRVPDIDVFNAGTQDCLRTLTSSRDTLTEPRVARTTAV